MCLGRAEQHADCEPHADARRLGDFLRFENAFKLMIFGNGQGCWAGPSRSMTVRLWNL